VVKLRVLGPDDWQVWRALRLVALADAPYAFESRLVDWQGDRDREERWRSRMSTPGSYHVVALLDDEPAGMAAGLPTTDESVVQLVSMWVSPDARGHGVGDALVRAVERWARNARAQLLRLSVAEGNEAAFALYMRSGFRWTGELGDLMPDGVHREQVLVKPLADA
jgi:ribosomal protein S18 acetylase RimI-like enzyme